MIERGEAGGSRRGGGFIGEVENQKVIERREKESQHREREAVSEMRGFGGVIGF